MELTAVLLGAVNALLVCVWGIITWAFIDLKKKADKTEKDLADYKVMVAEKYVSVEEMREAVSAINRAFESYSNKLDVRLDRMENALEKIRDKQ